MPIGRPSLVVPPPIFLPTTSTPPKKPPSKSQLMIQEIIPTKETRKTGKKSHNVVDDGDTQRRRIPSGMPIQQHNHQQGMHHKFSKHTTWDPPIPVSTAAGNAYWKEEHDRHEFLVKLQQAEQKAIAERRLTMHMMRRKKQHDEHVQAYRKLTPPTETFRGMPQ